jgi:hypothetical protein
VNITKSITIDGGGGVASVMVSGGTGITVSAGATDIVTIRNVQVQGDFGNGSSPGTAGTGIQFNSGAILNIDSCKIDGFNSNGIIALTSASAILNVTNTIIANTPDGIALQSSGGALNGSIDHTTIRKNSNNGIASFGTAYFTVTNSAIVNAAGSGVRAGVGGVLEIDSASVTNNNTAFTTTSGGTIRISRNTIYDNDANFAINGGTIATGGNNYVAVNGSQAPNASITQQ